MEGLERLRKSLIYPTDLRGHLISHSLSVGLFASVSVDKLPEPFPQLIVHQRNADLATSLPHTFCMDFTTFTFVI